MLIAPLFAATTTWITPVWLLAAGVFVGMVVLAALYGITWLVSRRTATTIAGSVREGFLFPVLILGLALSLFALAASFVVPFRGFVQSVVRLGSASEFTETIDVPADAKDQVVDLGVAPAEVNFLELTADRDMYFTLDLPGVREHTFEDRHPLAANESYSWSRADKQRFLFYGDSTRLYLTNNSAQDGRVEINVATQAEYPETAAIPATALFVVVVVGAFILLRLVFPRTMAIATTTAKEALATPLYQIVMAIGVLTLLVTVFIPYNTFGEDVKVLKDYNLSLIMLLSIFVALWTASVGISEEIEGRTALTVLSKPLGRPQFLFGKFIGVLLPVLLMFLFLGTLFLISVSFKVVYDARESAQQEPTWQLCYSEMINTVPGLALAFMESIVMASISVAVATRLPMLANLAICFTIYVVGHLLPLLAQSRKVADPYGIVEFVGRFFATVLPVLEHFNIYAAIAGGAPVPWTYLGWAFVYCALYSSVAMLFALLLFEDRDLA